MHNIERNEQSILGLNNILEDLDITPLRNNTNKYNN